MGYLSKLKWEQVDTNAGIKLPPEEKARKRLIKDLEKQLEYLAPDGDVDEIIHMHTYGTSRRENRLWFYLIPDDKGEKRIFGSLRIANKRAGLSENEYFFASDKRALIRAYEQILKDANNKDPELMELIRKVVNEKAATRKRPGKKAA